MTPQPVVHVHGVRVVLSRHSISRYHERVCPAQPNHAAAAHHLAQLLQAHGQIEHVEPDWLLSRHHHEDAAPTPRTDVWITVGDLVFPVVDGHIRTCLCKGHISDLRRRRRNDDKARRRAAKAARRRGLDGRREAA